MSENLKMDEFQSEASISKEPENSRPHCSGSRDSTAGADGTLGEEGENQDDDPSSSSEIAVLKPAEYFESELDNFRQQWQKEIKATPQQEENKDSSPQNVNNTNNIDSNDDILKQAKNNFLRGVQEERKGNLYEAISFYRRAVQLVPDIEFQIANSQQDFSEQSSTVGDEESSESLDVEDNYSDIERDEDDCEDEEITDLLLHIEGMMSKTGALRVCKPAHKQKMTHFSQLPSEIFNYILKWVVSSDLDCHSLEQVSKVCRGFYLSARDASIWRLACLRIWGVGCGLPSKYSSWRHMFIYRPHLWFHGAYISKTTYIRYGESSFQDSNYRPCYIVEYYRYLRFFPEGLVLMLTTPESPYQSLSKLRQRMSRHQTVMSGHYRLVGSTVMVVLKRPKGSALENQGSSSSSAMGAYARARSRQQRNLRGGVRPPETEPAEESFDIEMEIQHVKHRPNFKLVWTHYSLHRTFRNGDENVSNIDMTPTNFPPFWFSRVRSFSVDSESLLQ